MSLSDSKQFSSKNQESSTQSDELRSALDELQQREELAKQAEQLFHIGHYVYDEARQRYLYLSEGFARIHGTTIDAHINSTNSLEDDLEQVVEADRERVSTAYEQYIATGKELDIEYRIERSDGVIRWVRELNHARSMKNNRVHHTLGVLQDITRQKDIEMALRFRDDLAQQVESITDIGHFIFDEIADRYVFVSQGCANIYGVSVDYLLRELKSTEQDMQFVHPDDRQAVQELYDEAVSVDEDGFDIWELEYRMVRPDGDIRWVREVGKTHVIEPGVDERTTGVMIDITRERLAEQRIREANEELENKVLERTSELNATVAQLEKEAAERKRIAAEMQHLANHDALTGLPSLRLGLDRLQQAIVDARRDDHPVVVMFLDLDGFKKINDEYGHHAGDQVLVEVASRVRSAVREQDTVARIGGDEFMVVLRNAREMSTIEKIATIIIQSISKELTIAEGMVKVGVSIGISQYPKHGTSPDELIRRADQAMYQVKRHGKNDYWFAES